MNFKQNEEPMMSAITIMKNIESLELKTKKPKDRNFNKKNIFRRTANSIIKSGEFTGNGCSDVCTIFIDLAIKYELSINRVLITADYTTHKPHTLLEIYDIRDNKFIVLDPKWMLDPKLSLIAEKDQWFSRGLKQIKVSNNKDLEVYSRPSPSGEDRKWVVIDELPTLPVKNYNTLIRREKIDKFFN